jgi:hypothetical protein
MKIGGNANRSMLEPGNINSLTPILVGAGGNTLDANGALECDPNPTYGGASC